MYVQRCKYVIQQNDLCLRVNRPRECDSCLDWKQISRDRAEIDTISMLTFCPPLSDWLIRIHDTHQWREKEIPECKTSFSHFGVVSGLKELQILLQCALPKHFKMVRGECACKELKECAYLCGSVPHRKATQIECFRGSFRSEPKIPVLRMPRHLPEGDWTKNRLSFEWSAFHLSWGVHRHILIPR